MVSKQKVIAIDGPSASGKGTIASRVATILGMDYLDSGALYRLSALYAQKKGCSWSDEKAIAALVKNLPVEFVGQNILLAGEDVTEQIRMENIGMGASLVAQLPEVRAALLQRQRDFLSERGLVADGRDMGSVVFPEACLKIFLTATAQVRAIRRVKQIGLSCEGIEFERILADIELRDKADQSRTVAPLKQLSDAQLLDTTDLNVEESVKKVIDWYSKV